MPSASVTALTGGGDFGFAERRPREASSHESFREGVMAPMMILVCLAAAAVLVALFMHFVQDRNRRGLARPGPARELRPPASVRDVVSDLDQRGLLPARGRPHEMPEPGGDWWPDFEAEFRAYAERWEASRRTRRRRPASP